MGADAEKVGEGRGAAQPGGAVDERRLKRCFLLV